MVRTAQEVIRTPRWEELYALTARYYPDAPLQTAERYAKAAAKWEELRAGIHRGTGKPNPTYFKLAQIVAALGDQVGIARPSADGWSGDDNDWGVIRGVTHSTGFLPVDRAAILVDCNWRYALDND